MLKLKNIKKIVKKNQKNVEKHVEIGKNWKKSKKYLALEKVKKIKEVTGNIKVEKMKS